MEIQHGFSILSSKESRRQYIENAKQKSKLWKEPSVDVFPSETYKVSEKLTIQAIPLEFYRGDVLQKHGESITRAIQNSDGVIFEYFPTEIKPLSDNLLAQSFTNVDWFMPYYEHAANAAAKANKEVFALDPAHKLDFMMIRQLPVLTFGVGAGSFLAAGTIEASVKDKDHRLLHVSAAQGALVGVGLGAIGLSIFNRNAMKREHKSQSPSHGFTEPHFRRIVIAQGIKNLAATMDADPSIGGKKLVLLYPPVHWKGIKEYLDNPDKLKRNFRVASAFKVGPLKDSLFSIRNYTFDNNDWKLQSQKQIV